MLPKLIDTHCHLDSIDFNNNREEVIDRAKKAGLAKMITIGCDMQSSNSAKKLAINHDDIFFSAGVHPHEASKVDDHFIEDLANLSSHKKCVAIGECGLDYYYEYCKKQVQQKIFAEQISFAHGKQKPLVVHVRDAWSDCLDIFNGEKLPTSPGVIHCFTGSYDFAKACIDLGFFISFSGIITFNKAQEIKDIAKKLPLDKILIETDSPYLAPKPFRGKQNEPQYVKYIAQELAKLKNISLEEVITITGQNAHNLFKF